MPIPEPNSPEAMKQARKVRDIFFFIAILNIVLIFIVMCRRPDSAAPGAGTPTPVVAPGK